MLRLTGLTPYTVALLLGASPLLAQDPAPAPAPAPAAAPSDPDSNEIFVGDWDWTGQMRDNSLDGMFRINYANGRVTGVVARPGMPPSPIRSWVLRNKRDFTMTVDFNGELYTFVGRLENVRTVSGSLQTRGSIGRLRAQKRAG